MTDTQGETDATVEKLKALRASQLERIWPAAELAATSGDHEDRVELIQLYTAVKAIDFALSHRPDPDAATRIRPGFRTP